MPTATPNSPPISRPIAPPVAPLATYRVQFCPGFTFRDARGIVPYLADLGISHLYASPILQAPDASTHGYDITDPTRIRSALGGRDAFDTLGDDLRTRNIGILLDIVPNHMAATGENPWWRDVLARGRGSPYADFFDIDWDAADGRLILPILGAPLADLIHRAELRLVISGGAPELACSGERFPLDSGSAAGLLAGDDPAAAAARINADPRALGALLDRQHYRLVGWRDGLRRINYRRFFDVTGMAALRAELPRIFDETHGVVLSLLRAGRISGLRIDHIDGLHDPLAYLTRLDRAMRQASGIAPYVLVEKILADDERLPADWPVSGTTGYEALNIINRIFVDPAGVRRLRRWTARLLGEPADFADVAYAAKKDVLARLFPAELDNLTSFLQPSGEPGVPPADLRGALIELTACLPVYRTYISSHHPSDDGRRWIARARAIALRRARAGPRALDAVCDLLLGGRHLPLAMRWQQLTGPVMAKGVEDTALYRDVALTSLCEVGGQPVPPRAAVDRFHEFNAGRAPGSMTATSTHDTKRSEDARARLNVLSELAGEWTSLAERWMTLNDRLRTRPGAPSRRDELRLYQSMLAIWPLDPGEPAPVERLKSYALKAAREAKVETSWTDPDGEYERALGGFVESVSRETCPEFVRTFAALHRRVCALGAINSLAQTVLKLASPGVPDIYQGTETWDFSLVDPDNRRPIDYPRLCAMLGGLGSSVDTRELCRGWRDGRIKLHVVRRMLEERRVRAGLYVEGRYERVRVEGSRRENVVAFAREREGEWGLAVVPRVVGRLVGESWGELWEDLSLAGALGGRGKGTRLAWPRGAPGRWREVFTGREVEGGGVGELLGEFPVAYLVGV